MKVIIAGSRHIDDYDALTALVDSTGWTIEEVVSGGCRGVDMLGERWAAEHGVPVRQFAADWAEYGRVAGELRNREMAAYADGLILLWDGKSPGASCMFRESAKAGIVIRHQIYGENTADMDAAEQAILDYSRRGKGRLVYSHGHWEWETADAAAPVVSQGAVEGLIKRGLMAPVTLTVLNPVHEHHHSTLA